MRTYSLNGMPALAARCSSTEFVASVKLTFFIGYSLPRGFEKPERERGVGMDNFANAVWAADAVATMLERVRRAVLAEYQRRIAQLTVL